MNVRLITICLAIASGAIGLAHHILKPEDIKNQIFWFFSSIFNYITYTNEHIRQNNKKD